ncbi:MAG TPA: hypothetical protein ENO11_04035 [Desulfobacteraceae bacterium]|nr:hypothetical protein [Desulfobacteraceae bacterium]
MAVVGNSRTAALWSFAEAVKRNPGSEMYLNNFAFMLMEFEQFCEARKILEQVTEQAPEFLSARVNLALADSALGKYARGGDGLRRAVALFPRQADYYSLGAQAYHRAGMDYAAWSLASLGQQYYSNDYDFNSLISGLDYPATSPGCTMPASCLWNDSCLDFMVYGSSQPLIDVGVWKTNYENNTLNPEYVHLAETRDQCRQGAANRGQICLDSSPPELDMVCYCRAWIEEAYCDLAYEQAIFGSEAIFHGLLYGRYLQAQGETQTGLSGIMPQLQPAEYQYLDCKIIEDFALILDGAAQDERDTLSAQMQYILIARNNLSTIVSACNANCSNFELWLYTSGADFSTEPTICYGPVCVSFDSSGKVSVSFAFGPAIKLSYDPLKENWGFALGLGVQFGVGQWAAGGAVVVKFDNQKTGVAVTGGALYTSAEQFFGFQRIPVKVSYP